MVARLGKIMTLECVGKHVKKMIRVKVWRWSLEYRCHVEENMEN